MKTLITQEQRQMEEVFIHFNTKEHYITLDEFVQTVNTYNIIACDFSENIFKVKNGVKVYILPPEEGSFLICLGLTVSSAVVNAIISEEFKGFIKGVTDGKYELGDAGEKFGKILTGFMSKPSQEISPLEQKLPKGTNIDAAIKVKADFYSMCSRNREIEGVGFTKNDNFPIKRNDFLTRAIPPTTKPLPAKEELKELVIAKSVNIDEDLQWDFKDVNTKETFSANIEDNEFNAMILNGQCPLKKNATPDIILALVEFRKKMENGKERKDSYIVKEIYKFNSKKLKSKPKGLILNKLKKLDDGQQRLFNMN